ncbi:TPA: hypothetical protein NIG63_006117 [Pseudomonas aeruginosa]|nr:hypothetical protein [Pseudomonas aeruginosa]
MHFLFRCSPNPIYQDGHMATADTPLAYNQDRPAGGVLVLRSSLHC